MTGKFELADIAACKLDGMFRDVFNRQDRIDLIKTIIAAVYVWRPMASAPRDRDFLVQLKNGYVTRGRYINAKYFACDGGGPSRGSNNTEPLCWMELPVALLSEQDLSEAIA